MVRVVRGGGAATAVGFGFEEAEGAEDEAVGVGIEFSGFGDSEKKVDGPEPFVAGGDDIGAGACGIGGRRGQAGFFIIEIAEFGAELDPFVDEGAEALLFAFGADEDFIDLGANFGCNAVFELCGLAGFVAIGFLDAGEAVGNELVAEVEQRGAIGAEEDRGGGEQAIDAANEVIVAVVDIGLFFDDFE